MKIIKLICFAIYATWLWHKENRQQPKTIIREDLGFGGPWLLAIFAAGSLQAQINDSFIAEEWWMSGSGDCVVVQHLPLGEPRANLLGFWVRDSSCALANAPQDVSTDNWRNYRDAVAANVPDPIIPALPRVTLPDELLNNILESLKWFVDEAKPPAILYGLQTTPIKTRSAPKKLEPISKIKAPIIEPPSYLGDRL